MDDVGAVSETGTSPQSRNGRTGPRGPRPEHVRKKIGDTQRGVPKSPAHREALRLAHARADTSPTLCERCPDAGPFKGPRGLKMHQHHRHHEKW